MNIEAAPTLVNLTHAIAWCVLSGMGGFAIGTFVVIALRKTTKPAQPDEVEEVTHVFSEADTLEIAALWDAVGPDGEVRSRAALAKFWQVATSKLPEQLRGCHQHLDMTTSKGKWRLICKVKTNKPMAEVTP